jgi:hypothetical protein
MELLLLSERLFAVLAIIYIKVFSVTNRNVHEIGRYLPSSYARLEAASCGRPAFLRKKMSDAQVLPYSLQIRRFLYVVSTVHTC